MTDDRIRDVIAWEALDSRGRPTVACQVTLASGASAHATVPSGASTGRHEARELRDGGDRYGGYGVRRAVQSVHQLAERVVGVAASEQVTVDRLLREGDDEQLTTGGGNAVLAISVATALAAAAHRRRPLWRVLAGDGPPLLPRPMVNVVSGGAHAAAAVDIQDVLAVPVGAATIAEAIEWVVRVRRGTADELTERGHAVALVADEGGLAAPLRCNAEALEVVTRGIERAGLVPSEHVALAVDVAATQIVRDGRYHLAADGRTLDPAAMADEVLGWLGTYPVVSVEDPLDQDDWAGWADLARRFPAHVQLVGDDLLATSLARLRTAVHRGAATAVLVKPNQNGTLTGAAQVCRAAQEAGWRTVVSARSGDTEDAWLADLAVGWRAGQIKVGSTMRSERTAKWNRLLQIAATRPDAELAAWHPVHPPQEKT